MESTRPPTELLTLRSATSTYLAMLKDAESWAHEASAVAKRHQPDLAGQLDWLHDELRAARQAHESGTPAAIARVVAELLGEA